jgi:hypothetical protein
MNWIPVALGAICLLTATPALAQPATRRIVKAAEAFLQSLDEEQRKSAVFAFDDEAQRKRWSNFPIQMVPRAGVSLAKMTAAQRSAAMQLLSAALSQRGLEKVQEIMEGDEQLRSAGRGGSMFGKDLYFFSILGTPSEKKPWMLQFGGHHLALNITIAGAEGILTPSLTAAQPALFTLNGKTVRPLGQESDKALALLASLNEEQRKQAILNYRVGDLVLGPGKDGQTIEPEGLKVSAMNERQKAMLLDVIAEWSGIVHDAAAAARLAEIKAGLADTWFAWSGATTAEPGKNITAYYRIQGPRLVIEYSPQRMGSDSSLHVHTIYRDPVNDYGRKTAAR